MFVRNLGTSPNPHGRLFFHVLLSRRKMRRPQLTTAVCHALVRNLHIQSLSNISIPFFQSVLRQKNLLDHQHPLTPNMPHSLKRGSTLSGDDASCVVSAGNERNWKMISKICAEQDLRDVLSIPSGWFSIFLFFFFFLDKKKYIYILRQSALSWHNVSIHGG